MAPSPYIVAIVPARGGSKRIHQKNLLPVAGEPLVVHTIRHALGSASVHETWVSTDDSAIAAVANESGARVVMRPPALADDTATSESALLHALDHRRTLRLREPDLVVFLQPTSPVRRPDDIDRAVAALQAEDADSLFSACENSRLIWAVTRDGPRAINYDYQHRRREQDMERQYRENGSIYVMKPDLLRRENNRLGGRIAIHEMDYWSSFQIDTPEHAELCDWIMRRPEFARPVPWPSPLELVVFDFDGVMTDNALWVGEDGHELARCTRGDGLGVSRLRAIGVPMLIVSTEERTIAAARATKLGIPCHHGVRDKGAFLREYAARTGIALQNVVYVGNDVNDLPALELVGLPVVVRDAHPDARRAARFVLERNGGDGAVRELADRLLAHLAAEAARTS